MTIFSIAWLLFDKQELPTGISHPITFTTPGRVVEPPAESTLWNHPSEQASALLKMIKSAGKGWGGWGRFTLKSQQEQRKASDDF